jgi:hypothetical protein
MDALWAEVEAFLCIRIGCRATVNGAQHFADEFQIFDWRVPRLRAAAGLLSLRVTRRIFGVGAPELHGFSIKGKFDNVLGEPFASVGLKLRMGFDPELLGAYLIGARFAKCLSENNLNPMNRL